MCTNSACGMSSLLGGDPQTILQGSEASFWGPRQTLGIADRGLSTPQRQQDWLDEKKQHDTLNKNCTTRESFIKSKL